MKRKLNYLNKKELISEIECLRHNLDYYKEKEEIGYQRLLKFNNYLIKQGLSQKEINKIMQLDFEKL